MAGSRSQFRKIGRYVWRHPAFKRVGTDAQLLFLYLWTGPDGNASGVIATTAAALAVALHWPTDRAQTALDALADVGLLEVDGDAELVVLDLLDLDPPDNPNVVQHWAVCLADLPASPAIARAIGRLGKHCAARGHGFIEGFTAMTQQLPERFRDLPAEAPEQTPETVSPTVCHTVEQTVSNTVPHTVSIQRDLERERDRERDYRPPTSGSRARERGGEPERVGDILERMAMEATP